MKCNEIQNHLGSYIYGELQNETLVRQIEEHLSSCRTCRRTCDDLRKASGVLEQALANESPMHLTSERRQNIQNPERAEGTERRRYSTEPRQQHPASDRRKQWLRLALPAAAVLAFAGLLAGLFIPFGSTVREKARIASEDRSTQKVGPVSAAQKEKRGRDVVAFAPTDSFKQSNARSQPETLHRKAGKRKPLKKKEPTRKEITAKSTSALKDVDGQPEEKQKEPSAPRAGEQKTQAPSPRTEKPAESADMAIKDRRRAFAEQDVKSADTMDKSRDRMEFESEGTLPSNLAAEPSPPPVFTPKAPNPVLQTQTSEASVCRLNTDTASYAIARQYLNQNKRPPPAAIRTADFINGMNPAYSFPKKKQHFSINVTGGPSPFEENKLLLQIGIQAQETDKQARPPVHVIGLADVSHSMGGEQRFGLVKTALKTLRHHLTPSDRLTLICFRDKPYMLLKNARSVSEDKLHQLLQKVETCGRTNLLAGLESAYKEADQEKYSGHETHILLFSDGATNEGPDTVTTLQKRMKRFAQQEVSFTSAGVGVGTYNGDILRMLAQRSGGQYVHIDSASRAEELFAEQGSATSPRTATRIRVQTTFNPDYIQGYRLLGHRHHNALPETDKKQEEAVDELSAGDSMHAGQSGTVLYELTPSADFQLLRRHTPSELLGKVYLRYRRIGRDAPLTMEQKISRKHIHPSPLSKTSPQLLRTACAAQFAEILREPDAGDLQILTKILKRLQETGRKKTDDTSARELLRLIPKAR